MNEFASVVENGAAEVGQPVQLGDAVSQGAQKYRNIVIGLRVCIATRAREPYKTTRSSRSPYISLMAARKRFNTGSVCGFSVIRGIVAQNGFQTIISFESLNFCNSAHRSCIFKGVAPLLKHSAAHRTVGRGRASG
jgi:hypothetical protein